MRVVSIMGSPHYEGNTATVLGWVEDGLRDAGHSVERLNILDHEIYGCRACNACKLVSDAPGCIISDDAAAVLKRMIGADLLLLASPLYCWGFTAQLKALLDRCYCLKKPTGESLKSLLAGRRIALLMTAAGPYENNLSLIEPVLAGMAWFLDLTVLGKLLVPGCTTPAELGGEVADQARQFAELLAQP